MIAGMGTKKAFMSLFYETMSDTKKPQKQQFYPFRDFLCAFEWNRDGTEYSAVLLVYPFRTSLCFLGNMEEYHHADRLGLHCSM